MQSLTYIDYEDVLGIDGTVQNMLQVIDQFTIDPYLDEK